MAGTPPSEPPTKPLTTKPSSLCLTKRRRHHKSTLSPLIPAVATALSAAHSFLLSHDLHLLPSLTLSLDSSLSSASLSLSKLQSLLQIKPPRKIPKSPSPQPISWFHRFLLSSPSFSSSSPDDVDPRWAHIFRMSRPTFSLLNSTLSQSLSSSLPSIPSHFALAAALYRLAHNGSFTSVGKRFGLSSKDTCRVFYTVCKVICDDFGCFLGRFGDDMEDILAGFNRVLLPNCCGVLGLGRFPLEGHLLGKDGFLMVQALVDCNGKFLDVSAGWPCMFNPTTILRESKLFTSVEESKELLNGLPIEVGDGELIPQYLLGDCCYPLMNWLVTPFAKRSEGDELSSKELEFNEVHKKAMGFVKVAFERVRANWQLLNRRWEEECVEFLPFVIVTACLLNNFLLKHGELVLYGEPGGVEELEFPVCEEEVNETARRTRDLLASHISSVSLRN